jgi:hypothetical protein
MIHLLITHCSVDLLPIEESPFYKNMVSLFGEEAAREFTYEVPVPPLEDEEYGGLRLGAAPENHEGRPQLGRRDYSVPDDP